MFGGVLLRLLLALFAALSGIWLILYEDKHFQSYLADTLKTRQKIQELQGTFYALQNEILHSAFFLYYSYDRLERLLVQAESRIQSLEQCRFVRNGKHPRTCEDLEKLHELFGQYTLNIHRYLTINAALKNSLIYIPTLQLRAFKLFESTGAKDRNTLILLSRISASIFLARNAMDTDLLTDISQYEKTLDSLIPEYDSSRKKLLQTLRNHIKKFTETLPEFIELFNTLDQTPLIDKLEHLTMNYQKETARDLETVQKTSRMLLGFYLLSLLFIIYFILKTYRENIRLNRLKEDLEHAVATDILTGLGNRLAYRRKKSTLHHPSLILVNIDRFKHINEFYGTTIGDRVLQTVARFVTEITPASLKASIFRLGGDDFGVLFARENSSKPLEVLLKEYHDQLQNHQFTVEDLVIDLTFTLGASEKSDWLFETADMALKAAKNNPRRRYAIYTPQLDKREEIAKNIQTLRRIRHALDQGTLRPYFQPIYHLRSQEIHHYEALARIELDGSRHVLHPYQFIRAASDAKLSGEITLRILRETLKIARKYPFNFSVNISAGDIEDARDRKNIIKLLKEHRDLCGRMTFEILESEEIRDYELTGEFIAELKRLDCRIAIDDFGSGYSNFEKILQLNIDILKVDGSLIRKIDRDRHAELTVETILIFARQAGWETVAEFVHSKSVFEKVRSMGFDYVQGYYIGKPSRIIRYNGEKNTV